MRGIRKNYSELTDKIASGEIDLEGWPDGKEYDRGAYYPSKIMAVSSLSPLARYVIGHFTGPSQKGCKTISRLIDDALVEYLNNHADELEPTKTEEGNS